MSAQVKKEYKIQTLQLMDPYTDLLPDATHYNFPKQHIHRNIKQPKLTPDQKSLPYLLSNSSLALEPIRRSSVESLKVRSNSLSSIGTTEERIKIPCV